MIETPSSVSLSNRLKDQLRSSLISEVSISKTDGRKLYSTSALWGVLKGYKITLDTPLGIPRHALSLYEPEVTKSMKRYVKPGDICYDIGAYAGYHSLYLNALGATVYSFEPAPLNLELLRKNIDENDIHNIFVRPVAISDTTGTAVFTLHPFSQENYINHNGDDPHPTISVPVTTLDRFIEDGGLKPNFIKIDVEGEEWRALKGAQTVLADCQPVVVAEVRNHLWDKVNGLMQATGYQSRIISPARSGLYKLGVPNVLFVPKTY